MQLSGHDRARPPTHKSSKPRSEPSRCGDQVTAARRVLITYAPTIQIERTSAIQNQERQRRQKARAKACRASTTVDYDDVVVTALVDFEWLDEAEADDKRAIGDAITQVMADMARRAKIPPPG